jgi:signal transduction histidine kinase
MGLEQALMTLCDDWQQNTQTVCEFKVPTLPEGLNDYACVTVYRIVQEALTNVTRHAHAKHVRVQLTLDSQGLNLNIEDDRRSGYGGYPSSTPRLWSVGYARACRQCGRSPVHQQQAWSGFAFGHTDP